MTSSRTRVRRDVRLCRQEAYSYERCEDRLYPQTAREIPITLALPFPPSPPINVSWALLTRSTHPRTCKMSADLPTIMKTLRPMTQRRLRHLFTSGFLSRPISPRQPHLPTGLFKFSPGPDSDGDGEEMPDPRIPVLIVPAVFLPIPKEYASRASPGRF